MSRYLDKRRFIIYDYARQFVRNITRLGSDKESNYINEIGKGTIHISGDFIYILRSLGKSEQRLLFAVLDDLKFSDDYINGFVIEFKHSNYKDITSNPRIFTASRRKFIEFGLLLPIPGVSFTYIVNPKVVRKGKAKQPDRDYDGNVIDWNNKSGK